MAYQETGGFAFAPVIPRLDQYQGLEGIKPLVFNDVAQAQQSPIQFRSLPAWNIPSNKAEAIAAGISSGLGSIAQGIQAAYKSKRDREETFRKEAREDRLLSEKYAREDKQLAEKYAQAKDLSILKDQLRERLPSSSSLSSLKGLAERSLAGDSTQEQGTSMSDASPFDPSEIKSLNKGGVGGGSFESINLPDEESSSDIFKLNNGSSPLSSITAPAPTEAAPSPRGQDAINALSAIDWSKVTGSLGASTGGGAGQTDIPAAAPDWLRKPKEVTRPLSTLGGFSDEALKNTEKYLAEAEQAYKQPAVQPQQQNLMEQAIGIDAIYSEQDALALRDYAKNKGIPAKLKATRGGYEVSWPTESEIEKYRENVGGGKPPAAMKPEEIFKEEDKLRSDYLSQSKNFQVVQSAWNNLKGKLQDPTGASDMSMIFAYMKLLDPTSTVREGEYATASNVGTIPQTIFGKYNKAIEGKGFLDPKVRESFIKEAKGMYENALSSHKQNVDQFTEIARSYNLDPKRVAINLVAKDAASEIGNAVTELAKELDARKDVGSPDYKEKLNKLKELRRQQKQAQ